MYDIRLLPNYTLTQEQAADDRSNIERDIERIEEQCRQERLIKQAAVRDKGTRRLIADELVNDLDGLDDLIRRAAEGDAQAVLDQVKDLVDGAVRTLALERVPAHLRD